MTIFQYSSHRVGGALSLSRKNKLGVGVWGVLREGARQAFSENISPCIHSHEQVPGTTAGLLPAEFILLVTMKYYM